MPKEFFNRDCAVVYVDDSEDDHFLFQHAVRNSEAPLHVQPFFSAEPAIAYLKHAHPFEDRRVHPMPAFLLCDYDLKISECPELVKIARALPGCSTLPIIVFSGSDDEGCVMRSYLAGADHYLRKPSVSQRLDILVRTLYCCAMFTPRTFQPLTALDEYQRRPANLPITARRASLAR